MLSLFHGNSGVNPVLSALGHTPTWSRWQYWFKLLSAIGIEVKVNARAKRLARKKARKVYFTRSSEHDFANHAKLCLKKFIKNGFLKCIFDNVW